MDAEAFAIAKRWCAVAGAGWEVRMQLGRGGTAPVFSLQTPLGERALKIYDAAFSNGDKGIIEERRVAHQVRLGDHDCPQLIKVFNGGRFEDRLVVLMSRAPGKELEKMLQEVPRQKIRSIVDQVARACLFLRGNGLCHRDIKSANIFVTEDFEHVTLLDTSVMRDIDDHVGLGTDHGDQLPVVATARYSPPEYLFRLVDPGPVLWHAVDVYQLGGVLHDLIMRQPLFEIEYQQAKENRYRFAWVVATVDPTVEATDVDQDLIFTARRALDKDWKKRSGLTLEEFLANAENQRVRALDALGISKRSTPNKTQDVVGALQRISEIALSLEPVVLEHLRKQGVTAQHFVDPGVDDRTKRLRFVWPGANQSVSGDIEWGIVVSLRDSSAGRVIEAESDLKSIVAGTQQTASIRLPALADSPQAISRLQEAVGGALGVLAAQLVKV